jgi:hypothetical protein
MRCPRKLTLVLNARAVVAIWGFEIVDMLGQGGMAQV